MYFLPDNTKKCGYYECKQCGYRFLSLDTQPLTVCPDCISYIDREIGPDEVQQTASDSAVLLKIIEGGEVEKMDTLLSLAITGGDYGWI